MTLERDTIVGPPSRHQALRAGAKTALVICAIVIVQGILSLRLPVSQYFDLPLIYSVYYGFVRAAPKGAIAVGSAMGLMQDSLSGLPLGMNGFSKTLICYLSAAACGKFDVDQPVTRVLALGLFTLLNAALHGLWGSVFVVESGADYVPDPGGVALSVAFNVLFGMILFGFRSRFVNAAA